MGGGRAQSCVPKLIDQCLMWASLGKTGRRRHAIVQGEGCV